MRYARITLFASVVVVAACGVAAGETKSIKTPAAFDHGGLAEILDTFTIDGRVDYRGLAANPRPLNAYLAGLESIEPADFATWDATARMAFWINAYNAYTIRWILDHYPTDGILVTVSLWQRALGAPFNIPFIALGRLAGTGYEPIISLATIEHEILRKRFNEPRIHFAIVCASKSCPKLANTPYSAKDLDLQLDENARDFLGDPAKNRYDADANRLTASKIFKWFAEDFAPGGGPVGYFTRYGPRADVDRLKARESPPTVGYTDYDWSLNE